MTTFRDAIAQAWADQFWRECGGSGHAQVHDYDQERADAVLAMPEMEQLRLALLSLMPEFPTDSDEEKQARRQRFHVSSNTGLPEHMIAWVLGEDR